MSREEYKQYVDRPKQERRKIAAESGLLERKRFLLSSNPELKKRLTDLQDVVRDFQKQYPEVVSLSFYGSLTKGYATPESDIDATLFIDMETEKEEKEANPQRKPFTLHEFRKRLQEKLFFNPEQTEEVFIERVDKKDVLDYVHEDWEHLEGFFYLSVGGRKINKYRKIILDELEAMGDKGEEIWRNLCYSLCAWESGTHDSQMIEKRKRLYPWTIAEAKKYFLRGSAGIH